ncbi:BlaI/MecI/CopY family transcriptional regulator [Paenibacillus sambharensis]|uniref:BlaI/MecI/CopY family transcriptional regulator n=1 Tax=Paenibacillus sambharensis TaxID=1803190 RepID=A0A2W1L737_9BACL|nr:BlaI/MecI/CopY family transcriptional regulator [Paenibacillus sambharensis]PZD96048.1 BlaI/MecI/CopY family transcriptional regulator [Paenibacillus sambharensis]
MNIQHLRMNEEGLNRFFGPLEAKIMSIIWSQSKVTIREVQEALGEQHPLSFNSVMTVMNRLIEKGHLSKVSEGRGRGKTTLFMPVQTRDQFLHAQTKRVAAGLINEFGDLVVNHMVEAMEDADPALLERLEYKLNEMKERRTGCL